MLRVCRFIFLTILIFTFFAHSKSRRCESYFASTDNLFERFGSQTNTLIFTESRAEKELSSQEMLVFYRSKNIETLHRLIYKYLSRNSTVKFGPETLKELSAIALLMIASQFEKLGINFEEVENEGYRYITVLPKGNHPLNRFAKDINQKYSRKPIFLPEYVYDKFSHAAESDYFLILPIEASYDFTFKSSYIAHELIHARITDIPIPIAYKLFIKPQDKDQTDKKLNLRLGGYDDQYRFDELIAYERDILFSIQKILSDIKTGKGDSRVSILRAAVFTWLDLSEYAISVFTQLQKRGVGENNFFRVDLTEYNETTEGIRFSVINRQGISKPIEISLNRARVYELISAYKEFAQFTSNAYFISYRAYALAKLAALYLVEIEAGQKDTYELLKSLQSDLKANSRSFERSKTFDISVNSK